MDEQHETYPDTHHDPYSKTVFGFWLYLLSDFILFAAIFATYAVLQKQTFGGPSGKELFNLPFTLLQSLVLLTASFISGLAGAAAHRKQKTHCLIFFAVTALLGMVFLGMMLKEFSIYMGQGHGWDQSAFLSSFFTIVGTHGLHIVIAIFFTLAALPLIYFREITSELLRKLTCLKMFWQFLNIVWVFIFTLIYLLGAD